MQLNSMVYIDNEKIQSLVDIRKIVNSCDLVFENMRISANVVSPKKFSMVLPGNSSEAMKWINAMPAYLTDLGVAGLKWVSICSENTQRSLPTTSGLIILNDIETTRPFAILDAELITHYRTASTVLLAAKKYAPEDSKIMTIIGPGKEATYITQFLCQEFNLTRINVFAKSDKSFESFENYIRKSCKKFIQIKRITDLTDAMNESDIVISSSTSMTPLISKDNFVKSKKTNQFICGLTAFNDIDINILSLIDHLIFDDGNHAQKRIEEVSGVVLSEYEIKSISSMSDAGELIDKNGVNLYLPIGISAMDVAIAYSFYQDFVLQCESNPIDFSKLGVCGN